MNSISLGSNADLSLRYANRHGLITGATGAGKTSSMIRLASQFNAAGVPVFIPDMKGDVVGRVPGASALVPGSSFKLSLAHMGAELVARALNLTDAQQGTLEEQPLRHTPVALSQALSSDKSATARVIRRALNRLPGKFFGAYDFDVARLIDPSVPVTVLACDELMDAGNLYAATMVYMLRDLYDRLPEIGDGKPLLAFFIDEAHMLFRDCPKSLLAELEKIVRLIRSKGVSLWFVTQSPADVPASILGQLQNRVQHSLRAATPQDWAAVKVAVDTMPAPALADIDMHATIGNMAPGQALVSFVGPAGTPLPTRLVKVALPAWTPREVALVDYNRRDVETFDVETPAQDGCGADPFAPTLFARSMNVVFVFTLILAGALFVFECGLICLGVLLVVCLSAAFVRTGKHGHRRGRAHFHHRRHF